MVHRFELKVESTDVFAKKRLWEFIVIAANRSEVEAEIEQVMSMHDEVEAWTIWEWSRTEALPDSSPLAADYSAKSCHSYFT